MFYSIRQQSDRDQSIQDGHDAELEAARQEADSFSFGPRHKFTNTRLEIEMKANIEGINQGALLAALYNNARPQGMGFAHFTPKPMTPAEAQKLLDTAHANSSRAYFDYLNGRVMKIEIEAGATEIYTGLYNRDNGHGAAEQVIESLR